MVNHPPKGATITVGDISIAVTVAELPIDTLRYYPSNPRIYSILKQRGSDVSQAIIERELWNLDSTKDLYRDILKNRGLVEEILVRDAVVLEGNSRLCAYRHLLQSAKQKDDGDGIGRWSKIRAKILPSDATEESVFAILGILHIRGKAKWLPYEQASYLHRQSVEFRKGVPELAEQIGISKADVKNHIDAYKMMEEANVTDLSRFSYFLEYVKSRKLKEAAELMPPGRDLDTVFVGLVESGQIPKAENVRDDLPVILMDKKARKKFLDEKASFDEALEIARDRHPETSSSFYRILKRATVALNNGEPMRVKQEVEEDRGKKYILTNLRKAVNGFRRDVGLQGDPDGGKKRSG